MSQKPIEPTVESELLKRLDEATDALESSLSGLISLTPEQRQRMTRMSDKSEAFCRQAVEVFSENQHLLPATFDVSAMRRDLAALDFLRQTLARLSRLMELAGGTPAEPGGDIASHAQQSSSTLKAAAGVQAVNDLRIQLASRFDGSSIPSGTKPTSKTKPN